MCPAVTGVELPALPGGGSLIFLRWIRDKVQLDSGENAKYGWDVAIAENDHPEIIQPIDHYPDPCHVHLKTEGKCEGAFWTDSACSPLGRWTRDGLLIQPLFA